MIILTDHALIEFRYRDQSKIDTTFKFEFRGYTPFIKGDDEDAIKSGIYTFKTIESDSKPYSHKIE